MIFEEAGIEQRWGRELAKRYQAWQALARLYQAAGWKASSAGPRYPAQGPDPAQPSAGLVNFARHGVPWCDLV